MAYIQLTPQIHHCVVLPWQCTDQLRIVIQVRTVFFTGLHLTLRIGHALPYGIALSPLHTSPLA
jgi:hypothetical protein